MMPPHAADSPSAPSPTPVADGFGMPAEFAPHDRCLICWPTRSRAYWRDHYMLAQATYAAVARAIAAFEPVLVIAAPGEGGDARAYCGSEGIEVVELPIDDSWVRDSGPIFLVGRGGEVAAAHFLFNSWGERYLPYENDAEIGSRLCELLGVRRYRAPFVLEGGSITVDGEGTLITTESCLLNPNRNPHLSQSEIEQGLKDHLGVEKVVWLKSGLGVAEDRDTDGHVDGVAAFIGSGRVLLHMVRDRSHPNYENLLENRRRLDTTDARGRELDVVEIDLRGESVRIGGLTEVATYVNFYQANGAVVVPTGGTGYDLTALEWLRAVFPDRQVVGVPTPVLGYGGGGIHCITQQVPAAPAVSAATGS
jgi:agmatine deiminase